MICKNKLLASGLALTALTFSIHPASAADSKDVKQSKNVSVRATLVNPETKAQNKEATVQVQVSGVQLVDPSMSHEKPMKGQAHIHYQLDDGPVIATPTSKLSFHGLSAGDHKLTVTLAANDHSPMGTPETLMIKIPA